MKQRYLVGPEWRRYVMTFKAPKTGTQRVTIQVGRENSEVFLDTIHLFAGNANIFRRDFDNGIVIVNATPSSKTVSLGGEFQKILGTQDTTINDGSTVSSVTLGKYDAVLLVRPDGQGQTTPPPAPEPDPVPTPGGEECGAPAYNAGDAEAIYLWKDCQGDDSWHFRVTGGGNATGVLYEGEVTSNKAFTAVAGFSMEGSDALNTSDPYKFNYSLQARKTWEDGVDFSAPLDSSVCFNATTHSNVRLGSGSVLKSLPLDLGTLLNCGVSTGPQPGDECGAPAFDAGTEQGAFLWKDCGSTDTWHLRVTAGGRTGTATQYTGSITSPDPVNLSAYSLESNDVVDTSNSRDISYNLYIYNAAQDGLDFNVSNSGGCFNATELSGGNLYLGASKAVVTAPIDLKNLGACL